MYFNQKINSKILIKIFQKVKIKNLKIQKIREKEDRIFSKNKIFLIIVIYLMIVLSFVGGQAFSKYTTKMKGEGSAEIATWNFKVNIQTEQKRTINLNSIYDNESLKCNKIAPGTEGKFYIIIDATDSDVGINYKIRFENENNKPRNLKFIYKEIEYNSAIDLEKVLSGIINANDENKEKILDIKWKWDYETGRDEAEIFNNDKIDTEDGINIKNYTFDVIVSGSQVEP